jgi:glycosyltransferase involved in cell wall biosynthesis
MSLHRIAFIIPTMDREKDLRVMLSSLVSQTVQPNQIIIVDGSYKKIEHVIHDFPSLNIDYVRVFPPSLSKQKNAGLEVLENEITLVGYLDDDLELYQDAVEKMISFWDNAEKYYGGAAFAITDAVRKVGKVRKIFGLDSDKQGAVLSTGFVSMLENPDREIDVDWLNGGATVWRRDVIKEFKYDEWFKGSGYMEDIDFSFNIGENYRLRLLYNARTQHHHHPIRGDRYFLLGKWQIVNRLYFVRKYKHRGLSMSKAWIASFILILLNLGAGLIRLDYNRLRLTLGNIMGVFISITSKEAQISGYLKGIK